MGAYGSHLCKDGLSEKTRARFLADVDDRVARSNADERELRSRLVAAQQMQARLRENHRAQVRQAVMTNVKLTPEERELMKLDYHRVKHQADYAMGCLKRAVAEGMANERMRGTLEQCMSDADAAVAYERMVEAIKRAAPSERRMDRLDSKLNDAAEAVQSINELRNEFGTIVTDGVDAMNDSADLAMGTGLDEASSYLDDLMTEAMTSQQVSTAPSTRGTRRLRAHEGAHRAEEEEEDEEDEEEEDEGPPPANLLVSSNARGPYDHLRRAYA